MKCTNLNCTVTESDLCNPILYQDTDISIIPKSPLMPLLNIHPTPRDNHCSYFFLYHRLVLPVLEYHINGILLYICVNFFHSVFLRSIMLYVHLQSVPLYC